jgi:hypothetical protein
MARGEYAPWAVRSRPIAKRRLGRMGNLGQLVSLAIRPDRVD